MYEAFNAQPKNIGEMLGRNESARIVVPEFQRGYSWEKKHVEAFWSDVTEFQKQSETRGGPEKYFLGPIVFRSESKEKIFLLDGQQRLATATILFAALRDTARGLGIQAAQDFARDIHRDYIIKEDTGEYALELGDTDKLYFRETVQKDPPTTKVPGLRSHRNIHRAQQILKASVQSKIASLNPTAALNELKALERVLRRDLIMAAIPVESERDAFLIFETLNDRGLRLSVPDLLLNYLMRVAQPETDRSEIREMWSGMLEKLGKRDISRFLRHMWVSRYGDLKSKDLFTALKNRIEDSKISSLEFTRVCASDCEKYVNLVDVDEEHIGSDAAPYVRRLVRQLDFQSSLPLLLSSYALLSRDDFIQVVKWILVFVTRYSIISNLDMSGLESIFFGLAREIRKRMEDPEAKKGCMAYIKDTLRNNSPSDEQIKTAVENLLLSPDEAKYVVARLATKMQTSTREVAIDEANLEHIFPKKPSEEWQNRDAMEPFLWHLGNLTMLGRRLNEAAANKGYVQFKREYYANASELVMAQEVAKGYKEWNVNSILHRAKVLAPFVAEIWNFDNPSCV